MKANEAPEKIYVSNYSSGLTYNWHNERLAVKDIEYIRTDVFMKKANKFIISFFHPDDTELKKCILDEFHKYMKGE